MYESEDKMVSHPDHYISETGHLIDHLKKVEEENK